MKKKVSDYFSIFVTMAMNVLTQLLGDFAPSSGSPVSFTNGVTCDFCTDGVVSTLYLQRSMR